MEWKVYGIAKYADENDKADLEKAVKDAETEEANLYTEDSYKAFEAALKTAKSVLESEKVSSGEVKAALAALVKAQNNLVKKAEDKNIAPKAAVDGICNYTTDLGGLAQLNNNIDPSSSRDWDGSQVDAGKGMWHNWNNRWQCSECMGKLYMGFRNGTGKYRCILRYRRWRNPASEICEIRISERSR